MRKAGKAPSTPKRAETRTEKGKRLRKAAMKEGLAKRKAMSKGKLRGKR